MSGSTEASVTTRWGRFTALGGPEIESRARALAMRIRAAVPEAVPRDHVRAMVMLGGYGRGEGGVLRDRGGERLHNNVDLLLILRGRRTRLASPSRFLLEGTLAQLEREFDVGIDFTVTSESYLRRAPCLVMWYDMRFGHKTLFGDADFVPGLERFEVERIPAWDVRNLLANRASLLVLNDFILTHGEGTETQRRAVIRHAAKAIIGFGDALLFFHGLYHWSYQEKRRRMRSLASVPRSFRDLYDAAAAFRLLPVYDRSTARNLHGMMERVKAAVEPIHRRCEALRLEMPELDWASYAPRATRRALRDALYVPRHSVRVLRNLALPSESKAPSRHRRSESTWMERLRAQAVGLRETLPIVLPPLLYLDDARALRPLCGEVVSAPPTHVGELRRSFLKAWGAVADPNLVGALARLGIDPEVLQRPLDGVERSQDRRRTA